MEKTESLSAPLKRINVLDALRGFALLGVIMVHMLQYFSVYPARTEAIEPLFPSIDPMVEWLLDHVISGRFINIFAFLFGLSFFIQMDRAARKGIDFRQRFLWRMLLLFLIGMVGNAFFSGDIISIYAVFGTIMVLFQKAKNWLLLLLAGLLLIGTPRMLQIAHTSMTTELAMEDGNVVSAARETFAQGQEPSFWNTVRYNYTHRLAGKLDYQFGLIGRGYLTLALFLLGLVVGRIRFFENLGEHKRRNLRLFLGFALGGLVVNASIALLPAIDLRAILMGGGLGASAIDLLIMCLMDLELLLFSGAMALGFILLYQYRPLGKHLDILSPYGRMGLTNYELQGVIGCLLFNSWALGSIFGKFGPTELFVLGLLIYVLQVLFSKWWLKHFLYGPLEWLWRSGTYLKAQPFRRE